MRVLALALALALAAPVVAQDGDEIELRSDLVLVNVVATRGGAFATDLSKDDFTLTEDGAPQTIEFFGAEETAFACAVLVDTSGSMEYKLTLARAAAARFMETARPRDRVAVFGFADQSRQLQDFVPGGRDITDAVWSTDAEGATRMYDCIAMAAQALAGRSEQRRALLLISDGFDSGSRVTYDTALRAAQDAGATLYAIDLAPMGGKTSLGRDQIFRGRHAMRGFAEKTGGRYFASRGGEELRSAFASILDELGNQYTLGYYSTNAKRDGRWRAIKVKTTQTGVTLRAREGYSAPKS